LSIFQRSLAGRYLSGYMPILWPSQNFSADGPFLSIGVHPKVTAAHNLDGLAGLGGDRPRRVSNAGNRDNKHEDSSKLRQHGCRHDDDPVCHLRFSSNKKDS
jgi:hypothetical protein